MTDDAHLAQSVGVLLSTPVGSRVLRRDYGSDLPELIDQPMSPATVIDLYVATAEAIDKWEPRINLRRVSIDDATAGKLTLSLEAEAEDDLQARTIPVEVIA